MRSFTKGAFSLVLVLCYAFVVGQAIPAPTITCVSANQNSGDVVIDFGPQPLNACGAFLDYKIFGSDAGGAYQLVGTLVNPNATSFTHTGAGATYVNQWCYKIIMEQSCVGSIPDTSAPMCSQVLDIPRFTYVTVTPAGVQINWNPTVSPAVHHFVILYIDPNTGLSISLDTVSSTTYTYLDTRNNPNNSYITYTIKSLDSCDNPSIQNDSVQSTIYITATTSPCLQKTTIRYNRYQNWPGDIAKEYLLETVIDGGTPKDTSLGQPFPAGTPLTQRQSVDFSIAGLTGSNICFTIIAVSPMVNFKPGRTPFAWGLISCIPLNTFIPVLPAYWTAALSPTPG